MTLTPTKFSTAEFLDLLDGKLADPNTSRRDDLEYVERLIGRTVNPFLMVAYERRAADLRAAIAMSDW